MPVNKPVTPVNALKQTCYLTCYMAVDNLQRLGTGHGESCCEADSAIAGKVLSFYQSLRSKSPIRQGYLHHFSAGEDTQAMAKKFEVSTQTIKQAQLVDTENAVLQLKYPPNIQREKTKQSEIQKIKDYWYQRTIIPIPWKEVVKYKGKKGEKKKVWYHLFSAQEKIS